MAKQTKARYKRGDKVRFYLGETLIMKEALVIGSVVDSAGCVSYVVEVTNVEKKILSEGEII